MNITLYYIKGINETDTPVFDNLAHQQLFFSECERYVIDTGFYPPYFRNTITLDINDYDITSPSNYCSLNFNNKEYYYFIVAKRYINETVVEIDIEMDTIQTYMFDVEFINAFIDRITIPRWIQNPQTMAITINRDYIRENYSNGTFTHCDEEIILNDESRWFIVYKEAGTSWGSLLQPAATRFSLPVEGYNDNIMSPYLYYFAPLDKRLKFLDNPANPTIYVTSDAFDGIKYCAPGENTVDIYIIPFNPLENFTVVIDGNNSRLEYDLDEFVVTTPSDPTQFGGVKALLPRETDVLHPVMRNRIITNEIDVLPTATTYPTLGSTFNSRFVPAMIDENYLLFRFGDYKNLTEYPLYNLSSKSIYINYWCDTSTGMRFYNLTPTSSNAYDNTYGTLICNPVALSIDLKNTGWQNYISQNKCTILGAIMNSTSVTNFRKSMISAASSNESVGSYREGLLKAGGTSLKDYSNTSRKFTVSSQDNYKFSFGNTIWSSMAQIGNALAAPATVKSAGNGMTDINALDALIIYQRYLCDNFEEVAKLYESYGYKVMTTTTLNLFSIQYRYFYDYVQTKELRIHIGDRATENNFIERFNNGLRMWHTTNGVLNTKEVETINYFEMGQICIYDNVDMFLVH